MQGITESCSICSRTFEVQFRYQMEERDGGFASSARRTARASRRAARRAAGSRATRAASASSSSWCRRWSRRRGAPVRLLATRAGRRCSRRSTASAWARWPRPSPRLRSGEDAPPASAPASSPPCPVTSTDPPRPHIEGPRRLAIFNHKGGTGKTTTSVSIAAGLAARGARVLLVDTDSQGNVAVSLGVKAERSLYHVLVMGLRAEGAVVPVRPNLDLIVSNETLAAAELYLAGRQNRDRVLRDRLTPLFDTYDVIVLDCSPSLSLMNQNALVTADGVLVPVACDFLSLVGVRQVIKTVKNVNTILHHPVQIYGVLPTFYDARARICRDAVETMKEHFGDRCLAPIRSTIKIKEAPAQGKTIFEYAADSNAARDYLRVVDRLVFGAAAVAPEDVGEDDARMAIA